jgi:threonine/homoserine/homoserine lactone efflux protein
MLPFSTVALFIVAALALLLIPGPSVLYIVARSVNQGRRAGLVSAAGVGAGSLVHVSAATLGLSALLLSSALAFAAVKYLGAAYLIYLGIRTLRARAAPEETSAPARRSLGRIFLQGVVVNTLNPKTALFFFAFLPQFVDPARGSVAAQIGLLGLLMVALGTCTDSSYALLSGTLGGLLRGNRRFAAFQQYATGTVYIALGVSTALTGVGGRK